MRLTEILEKLTSECFFLEDRSSVISYKLSTKFRRQGTFTSFFTVCKKAKSTTCVKSLISFLYFSSLLLFIGKSSRFCVYIYIFFIVCTQTCNAIAKQRYELNAFTSLTRPIKEKKKHNCTEQWGRMHLQQLQVRESPQRVLLMSV